MALFVREKGPTLSWELGQQEINLSKSEKSSQKLPKKVKIFFISDRLAWPGAEADILDNSLENVWEKVIIMMVGDNLISWSHGGEGGVRFCIVAD